MSKVISIRFPESSYDVIEKIKKYAKDNDLSFNSAVIELAEKSIETKSVEKSVEKSVDMTNRELLKWMNENLTKKDTRKVKDYSYIDALLDEFYATYENDRGREFLGKYTAKDRAAMGKLLKKHKDKNPQNNSEQTLLAIRKFFESCAKIRDPFMYDKLSVSYIDSNLNSVINQINSNHGKTAKRKVSESDIARIVSGK